jgi:hypothetical protein
MADNFINRPAHPKAHLIRNKLDLHTHCKKEIRNHIKASERVTNIIIQ